MKPETEVLLAAACALALPENWTQKAYAKDADGNSSFWGKDTHDFEQAASWCVVAACYEAAYALRRKPEVAAKAVELLPSASDGGEPCPEGFNNTRSHGQVLKALYKAAETAEQVRGR